MNADDMSQRDTPMNSKSMNGLPKSTETSAPSQESPSDESSSPSSPAEGSTSLTHSILANGDPKNIRKVATNALTKVAEGTSGKSLSKEGKAEIAKFIDQTSRGFVGSMAMICDGERCPFLSACPLKAAGADLPKGSRCPVEDTIVATWVTKHLAVLGIENMEDPAHSFDMDMLYELAGQELVRWRCSVHLSDDPRLVSNQQVGSTVHGDPLFADVINPVIDVMERAGKNVAKIREALVATRKAQIAAGHDAMDPTQKQADLREKAEMLQKRREQAIGKEEVHDADFEVKD